MFFSIIIPSYNRAKFLQSTINSVQKQTFTDWECIVVDDGSTDNTQEVVEKITKEDVRVKYIYQENAERGAARNNGAANANGEYFCFLDSDDSFLENHLQTLYDAIQKHFPKKALFFTNAYNLLSSGEMVDRYCPDIKNYDNYEYILNYTFNPARACLHRDIFDDFQFNPDIPGLEDLDLWLRIATKYLLIQVKERTVIYNLHDETYTLGFAKRYERELKYFQFIFNQERLKGKLPKLSTQRLLSMCHYHIAIAASENNNYKDFYKHAFKSFILYPKGYNRKTNFPLLVQAIYMLPFIGTFIKKIKS